VVEIERYGKTIVVVIERNGKTIVVNMAGKVVESANEGRDRPLWSSRHERKKMAIVV